MHFVIKGEYWMGRAKVTCVVSTAVWRTVQWSSLCFPLETIHPKVTPPTHPPPARDRPIIGLFAACPYLLVIVLSLTHSGEDGRNPDLVHNEPTAVIKDSKPLAARTVTMTQNFLTLSSADLYKTPGLTF